VEVLHRGPGGIVPVPLTNANSTLYKGIDDDPHFLGWEDRALPDLTLKLQLVSAHVNRSAKPIPSAPKKKLMSVTNIVGRLGMNVTAMRKKREAAEEANRKQQLEELAKAGITGLSDISEEQKLVIKLYEDISEQVSNCEARRRYNTRR